MIILQKSAQRHYKLQDSDKLAIEKREGQERSEERDLSMKERSNRGPKLKMEGIYLGRKKERRRAKSEKWQTRGGVKIPSSSPDPLWAWPHLSLPHPSFSTFGRRHSQAGVGRATSSTSAIPPLRRRASHQTRGHGRLNLRVSAPTRSFSFLSPPPASFLHSSISLWLHLPLPCCFFPLLKSCCCSFLPNSPLLLTLLLYFSEPLLLLFLSLSFSELFCKLRCLML